MKYLEKLTEQMEQEIQDSRFKKTLLSQKMRNLRVALRQYNMTTKLYID